MKNYTIFGKPVPVNAVYYCKTIIRPGVVFLDEKYNVIGVPVGYYTQSALEKFRKNKKPVSKRLKILATQKLSWCIVNDDLTGWIDLHTGQVYMNDEDADVPTY